MEPVLTPAEMAEADRRDDRGGHARSGAGGAGRACGCARTGAMLGGRYGRRVVVVCGKGNNGGDGRVAARRAAGRGVGVASSARRRDRRARTRLSSRADLAVDAMYGTGFRGALEGDAARACAAFGATAATLAVDIPSGVDGTTGEVRGAAVRADETVSFAALEARPAVRPGRSHAGDVSRRRHRHRRRRAVEHGVPDVGDLRLPAPARRNTSGRRPARVRGLDGMIGAPMLPREPRRWVPASSCAGSRAPTMRRRRR